MGSFTINKRKYKYLHHEYNTTWTNERAVEVPIIWNMLKKKKNTKVLEVGNVLSHYYQIDHDVIDKYEQAPGVINQDIVSFATEKKYDLIISISTLEHVGWDENPKKPEKLLDAIENLRNCLSPKGRIVVTLPLGYNSFLDELLRSNQIGFMNMFCLKRVSKDNKWIEVQPKDILYLKYAEPYPCANGVIIGEIKNPLFFHKFRDFFNNKISRLATKS